MNGEHVMSPPMPAKPAEQAGDMPAAGGPLLGDVIDTYLLSVKQSGYTRKVKRCLDLFGAVIGRDTSVRDIKQRTVTQFLRDICKLPSNWAHQYDRGVSVAALLAQEGGETISPTTYRDNYRAPLGAFLAESKRDHGDDGFPELTVERIEYIGSRKVNEDQHPVGALSRSRCTWRWCQPPLETRCCTRARYWCGSSGARALWRVTLQNWQAAAMLSAAFVPPSFRALRCSAVHRRRIASASVTP